MTDDDVTWDVRRVAPGWCDIRMRLPWPDHYVPPEMFATGLPAKAKIARFVLGTVIAMARATGDIALVASLIVFARDLSSLDKRGDA